MTVFEQTLADLETAIGLARGGAAEAEAIGHAAAGRFPLDVTVLHKAGVIQQLLGRNDSALGYFHRALAVLPGFAYSELELGTTYEQGGQKQKALDWLLKAAQAPETAVLATLRAARVARELGDHACALAILQRACAAAPDALELNASLAQSLIYHDRRRDAAAAYARVIGQEQASEQDHIAYLYLLTELGDYADVAGHVARLRPAAGSALASHAAVLAAHARMTAGHDRAAVLAAASAREGSGAWLPVPAVIARVQAAIKARRAFSLVRFGDGEARFLAAMDGTLNPALTQADRLAAGESIWGNWFGTRLATVAPAALDALHAATLGAMATASILGVPTSARLAIDRLHFGYLATLERQLACIPGRVRDRRFTDAGIALHLHAGSPFYARLLRGLDSLGVISPHPGLAARLGRLHGVGATAEYVVPGETRLPPATRGAPAAHFPDVYRAVMTGLIVPRPGAVFLVAAGLLGKVYCARIKSLGGIAIDIGSVADAWMGFDTRPGQFPRLETWRLPEG